MKKNNSQRTEQPALEEEKKRANSLALIEKMCAASFGLKDGKVALQILSQAANLQCWGGSEKGVDKFATALGTLSGIGPKGAMEMLLAVQMMGVHNAALMFLSSATADGQDIEVRDANVLRSVRLMRLFIDQLEAMAKLKGKAGQQKVTVEHVHVHKGGQAIVGAVSTGKTDQGEGVK